MVVAVKKAGETAAKAIIRGGKQGAHERIPLRPPRAVTTEEAKADKYEPHRESNTSPMTPWKGWFQRWLQDAIGEDRFQKIRNRMLFMPDDVYDLQQSPKPAQKVPISKTDPSMTHQWRYPSPGSQAPPKEPEWEADEDPFDSGYFKRDTKRRYLSSELGDPNVEKAKLAMMDPDDPNVIAEKDLLEAGPESSPGNKGVFATGPSDFDPTGLRATMSVTWDAYNASLDQHMPDHLPKPVWMGHEEEIIEWYKERDLPVPVGGYYAPMKVPRERRVARW